MTYKTKSLLYFTCLIAVSIAYYHSEKTTDIDTKIIETTTIAQVENTFSSNTP